MKHMSSQLFPSNRQPIHNIREQELAEFDAQFVLIVQLYVLKPSMLRDIHFPG